MKTFRDPRVAAVFGGYSPVIRKRLLALRRLIFETTARTEREGELEETLKWGQPSYLTAATRSGSTIRIDAIKGSNTGYAVHFICHTNLVETFRALYGDRLGFEGNRSILLDARERLPTKALSHCIALALTYRLHQRSPTKTRQPARRPALRPRRIERRARRGSGRAVA